MSTFGARLKELRVVHLNRDFPKLTQKRFGEILGVSRQVIANRELDIATPNEEFINHVCQIFDVNKKWLVSGEGSVFDDLSDVALLNEMFAKLDHPHQKLVLKHMKELLKIKRSV